MQKQNTCSFYKNEAQISPEIKNKLRTIEARLQVYIEKHITSRHYLWRFTAGLFAVRNTEWEDKKIKVLVSFVSLNSL